MAKRKRLIPFSWLFWKKTKDPVEYELRRASYELDGLDLEIAKIQLTVKDELERKQRILQTRFGHGDISQYEFRINRLNLKKSEMSDADYEIAKLVIDCEEEKLTASAVDAYPYTVLAIKLKHQVISEQEYKLEVANLDLARGKITQHQYDKEVATANNEPFVRVIDMGFESNLPTKGYFELDWNDQFVVYLQNAGITGVSDDDIVNKWFNSVCRVVIAQESADYDYGLQANDTTGSDNTQ